MTAEREVIDLRFRECFGFPISAPEARQDLVVGSLWLLVPLLGWILNLGHRLEVVYRLHHHEPPYFRGFRPYRETLLRGLQAASAIAVYLSPAAASALSAWLLGPRTPWLWPLAIAAGGFFALAIFALPGGMTYNAAHRDMSYLYRPDRALRRAIDGGQLYLRAWSIALVAIALSLLGVLALGVGFLVTSVWAWQVVGYAFSRALALRAAAD